jgi:hypothetical protein
MDLLKAKRKQSYHQLTKIQKREMAKRERNRLVARFGMHQGKGTKPRCLKGLEPNVYRMGGWRMPSPMDILKIWNQRITPRWMRRPRE